jgi:hypothetical protein
MRHTRNDCQQDTNISVQVMIFMYISFNNTDKNCTLLKYFE